MTHTTRAALLIKEGEGLTIELKEKYTTRIAEDMVAFANSRGGTIILGVRDDRKITGERLTGSLKAQIQSLARNCTPAIEVMVAQAGEVITVAVPEGREKPYSCSAGYFRRLDAVTQKMTNHELRVLFRDTDGVRFEQQICRSCRMKDISPQKIRQFCQAASISMRGISPEAVLRGLELVTGSGITNAGVMLFGKKPSRYIHQCSMLLLAFKGGTNDDIYDRMDVKDDLLSQFSAAMTFIKKHINRRSIIEGAYRRDVYEVPEPVIREAVANAIVHRDYRMAGTDITVSVFNDRLEIKNPGGLPPGISEKTLGEISIRRNPLISEMFNRIDVIEKAGTGFARMKNALAREGFPAPAIKSESFFFITFKRVYNLELMSQKHVVHEAETTQMATQKATQKTAQKIIELMRRNATITRGGLAKATKLTPDGIKWHIAKLKAQGRIRRIGPDRGGRWEVVGKGEHLP